MYSRYGGLPYLINLPLKDETVNEYLKSVYSTIVFRDVVSRYNLRNSSFLEKLVQFLSENIGNLFSAKNISDYLKSQHSTISVNQIQNYTEYLNNAFLIHRVGRYDLIGKRLFEIGEKYYFENMGLRNIVIGYRITDRAKILENLVYSHLLYRGYDIKIGYYGDKEIDFIGEKDNEKVYIQVALRIDSEMTAEREFGNLLKIQDNYPKIVVTEDAFIGNSYEGIKHYSIVLHQIPESGLVDLRFRHIGKICLRTQRTDSLNSHQYLLLVGKHPAYCQCVWIFRAEAVDHIRCKVFRDPMQFFFQ